MPMHAESLEPTSFLDAINAMLRSIGESPISTLEEGDVDAQSAIGTLNQVSREVQGEGWHFNTDIGLKILPAADTGYVRLPANTLKVKQLWYEHRRHCSDLVLRGLRAYDRRRHTFVLDRPVIVDIVTMQSFEDLPQYARTYITVKAVRRFSSDETASDSTYRFTKDDEDEARVRLEQAEGDDQNANLKQDSPFINNIIRR